MNQSDLLNQLQAQQQAAMQHLESIQIGMIVFASAGFLVTAWVLYMFYARLRDIANELQKIRLAYEIEHSRKNRNPAFQPVSPTSSNPLASDSRYMPKA